MPFAMQILHYDFSRFALHELNCLLLNARQRNSCRRQFIASHLTRIQHIFNENAVARGGIVDEDVCHRADELAVLNDGRARQ